MSQLSRDLKKSRKAAYAAGTSRNHRTQWRTYLYFTIHFKLVFLPASVQTICLFCQFLSRSLTPPSIRNYLSGLCYFILCWDFRFPIFLCMSFTSLVEVLSGWHNIYRPQRTPRPLPLPLNSCTLLCLAGLIFTPRMSPFRVPFCSPFSSSRVSLTCFLTPWGLLVFRIISVLIVAMLSPLIMVYVFSLPGLKPDSIRSAGFRITFSSSS